MKTTAKEKKAKEPAVIKSEKRKDGKKSKFALYWESRKEMEPGFEIVDMRAVLR
jgi:hypothetical protein